MRVTLFQFKALLLHLIITPTLVSLPLIFTSTVSAQVASDSHKGEEYVSSELASTCSANLSFDTSISSPDRHQLITILIRSPSESENDDFQTRFQIKQWNLITGEEVRLPVEINPILSVEDISSTSSSDAFTRYYYLSSVAFTSEGKTFIGAYYDVIYDNAIIKSWDLGTDAEVQTIQVHFDTNDTEFGFIQLSSDGKTLIWYGYNNHSSDLTRIILWDLLTNSLVRTVQLSQAASSFAVSLDNQTAAFQAIDHTIRVQNLLNGKTIQTLESDSENQLALSSDGKTLFVSERNGSIKIIDTITGQLIQTLSAFHDTTSAPFLTLSADDSTLLVDNVDKGQIQQWNVVTGKHTYTFCIR